MILKIVIAGCRNYNNYYEAKDYIICFWDYESRGTKSMIEYAKKYSKPCKIKKNKFENLMPY